MIKEENQKIVQPVIGLINVVMDGDYQYEQEIPLGLAAIGAFLRQHGCKVVFHQCFASKGEDQFLMLTEIQADIYGFQLNLVNYKQTKAAVHLIKSMYPRAITVCGGPFLVTAAEEILTNEPLFDFVVVGEGEIPMLDLARSIIKKEYDFASIKGLVWRNKANKIIRNPLNKLIEDLDILPFPARDFLNDAKRDPIDNGLMESVRIVTSRGCTANCSFCCVNFLSKAQGGRIWRGRSPKNVVDECEYLSKTFGVKLFNFADSSFEDPGYKGKIRSSKICEEIIRREIPLSAKIYLRCDTMKSQDDMELLKLYKKAGIDVVIIGVEAGSDYELELYNKKATLEDNYRTVNFLRNLDLFYIHIGFIMFGPNSTRETLKQNIKFLQKTGFSDNIMHITSILMLIRGSKLYHVLKKEGRVIEDNFRELPKYSFLDPVVERMANNLQNIFVKYPITKEVNSTLINIANLVSRMSNPMNAKILDILQDDFEQFKRRNSELSIELGCLHHDYFCKTLDLIEQNCSDEELKSSADYFFEKIYYHYQQVYNDFYTSFLRKVISSNVGLSGLIFKTFYSAMALNNTKRFRGNYK